MNFITARCGGLFLCYVLGRDLGSDFERNLARRGVWSVLEVRIFDTQ